MTRQTSATTDAAVVLKSTRPIYLIRMGWDVVSPGPSWLTVATWARDISWGGDTWVASGLSISGLAANGGGLELPLGDADPWLDLVMDQIPRNRTIDVYEYHTDFSASPNESDATPIFSGYMDEAEIGDSIRINLIEGASRTGFPPGRIDQPTYNYLLPPGSRIQWGFDVVIAN